MRSALSSSMAIALNNQSSPLPLPLMLPTSALNVVSMFSSSQTSLRCLMMFVASSWFATSGGSAATALGDQVGSNTASLAEAKSARAINTKFGSTLGVDTASADMLVIIEGTVIVSVSGSLELKHASELAASTQVMADTVLELHKIN